jgi:hypothetical protein
MNLSDRDLVLIYVGMGMSIPEDPLLAMEVNELADRIRAEFDRRYTEGDHK